MKFSSNSNNEHQQQQQPQQQQPPITQYSTSAVAARSTAAAVAALSPDDEDVERYLHCIMRQILPEQMSKLGHREWEETYCDAVAFDDSFSTIRDNDSFREDSQALVHVELNGLEEDNADDMDTAGWIEEEFASEEAAEEAGAFSTEQEHLTPPPTHTSKQSKSVIELLSSFEPENPPRLEDFDDRNDALRELQLWLECEAQQESVMRYQKLVNSARDSRDYARLGMVQQKIADWFPKLDKALANQQRSYMGLDKAYIDEDDPDKLKLPGRKAYGPFFCALPSAKLAVITAHETLIHSMTYKKSARRPKHHEESFFSGEIPLVTLAMRIGEAVEEEVAVHRLLYRRFEEQRARNKELKTHDSRETGNDINDDNGTSMQQTLSEILEGTDEDEDTSDGGENKKSPAVTNTDSDENDKRNVTHKWSYAQSHLQQYFDEIQRYKPTATQRKVTRYAIARAKQVLEQDTWETKDKIQLGANLLHFLLENATLRIGSKEKMAFRVDNRWTEKKKSQNIVAMDEDLMKLIASDDVQSFLAISDRHKPMVVPPKPWRGARTGGYLMLIGDIIRHHGCRTQREVLEHADCSMIQDGLDVLGQVPWKVNERLLQVAQRCWKDNIPLGDIPSRSDFELPSEPVRPPYIENWPEEGTEEYERLRVELREYYEKLHKYIRVKQKNYDLLSLRCSAQLKLGQAEKFKDFDEIFFPYNLDFRGRAYPMPPHFSNVGSDLCRGMLLFSEKKPLGKRGLYWLKVHLANFAGMDKITFDDRAKFVDDNMDKVRASAADPFAGERWWISLDDPFQGLATCLEIVDAIDSGDPENYMCNLPVHMDGSCNGLQHYAALGRDKVGGTAVNMSDAEEPQDVYIGVMHEVIRRVADECERELGFDTSDVDKLSEEQRMELRRSRSARLVNGLIDRGVVKRTVMTSVYGVTYVGARKQIQDEIERKLEEKGHDVDEMRTEIFQACGYLAKVTMEVIGDLYTGAKGTMNWLSSCARLITQHESPVAWMSPIGLPAIQPYRTSRSHQVVTLLSKISVVSDEDDLPIHKTRQVSAFPPNYIHSLDSSHMILTALEMDRRGLTFSAVHDSFWTHPCDVDEMNDALREVFVDLYRQPNLDRLKRTWELRYPGVEFPDLPKRGDLDLDEIKKAKYFFQ